MNRVETKKAIAVMQAYVDGKQIEAAQENYTSTLQEGCDSPLWDWSSYSYRVKPEPIECWVNVLDGEICSTVYMTKEEADEMRPKMSDGWTTRKFREVIE